MAYYSYGRARAHEEVGGVVGVDRRQHALRHELPHRVGAAEEARDHLPAHGRA